MSSDNVEIKDGLKLRKLTELKTEAGKANEEAMLERVEYFKEKNQEKSIFNSTVQNTVVQALSTILDLKVQVDKTLGEENLKKVHDLLDNIFLFGL
jgi:hypothetical protein